MNRFTTLILIAASIAAGCKHQTPPQRITPLPPQTPPTVPQPTAQSATTGDEIIILGQPYHTGTRIVLWNEKGGYNAYANTGLPNTQSTPLHFEKMRNVREAPLLDAEVAEVKKNGWTLPFLRKNVDQFVIHYDVAGVSRTCFKVLHDRGLGVQFMLDIDGTIYQTMDLQEEAAHATKANGRSVGIEIANMGAYSGSIVPLMEWYKKDGNGKATITIPARAGDGGVRTKDYAFHPARNEIITGTVQGTVYHQYDFTPEQYNALAHLTAALCTVFPKIQCDYPRQSTAVGPPTTQLVKGPANNPATRPSAICQQGESGILIPHALTDDQYENYQGVLGHYHVQTDKQDPGPAFQWDRMISQARSLMLPDAMMANAANKNKPAKFIPSPPETGKEKE